MNFKKIVPTTLSLVLLGSTLAACTGGESGDSTTERTLRIATMDGDDGSWFRQQFTEIFEYAHKNIKLEFIQVIDNETLDGPRKEGVEPPDPLIKMKELMQGPTPPDVVMFDLSQMRELINENLLKPLDASISKDKFDMSGILPAITEGLKAASGDGKLYALAPLFTSSALIYNKKLFTDAGVEFPTDDMTWDQMFDLARRLKGGEGEDQKFGFNFYSNSFSDIFDSMNMYLSPLEIDFFDETGDTMLVDSDQLEAAWTKLIGLSKEKVIPSMDMMNEGGMMHRNNSPFDYDDFMSGRLAMTIMNYGELARIDNANKNAANYEGYTPIEYDVVTIPSHPENPGVAEGFRMAGMMGINSKAGNEADAWRFLKFINGEDWARAKSNNNYQLVSHKKYIKEPAGGLNMEAFFKIKPLSGRESNIYMKYRNKPNVMQAYMMGRGEFQQALSGQKSVRDALKSWKEQGDQMLKNGVQTDGGGVGFGNAIAVPMG